MSDILKALAADQSVRESELASRVANQSVSEAFDRDAKAVAYESRSAKQKHDDEIAGHKAWIANPKTASYFWVAVKDGVVHSREWSDACDCDDHAHYDASGHTLKVAQFPAAPFTLVAEPISAVQALPSASDLASAGHAYDIAEGDTPIWEHRVRWFHYADGTPDTEEDALVFGVRHADGSEEITTVDHNGAIVKHDSHEAALAHRA